MTKTFSAINTLQKKQLAELKSLLKIRKKHIKGKRVRLEGVTVYNTPQILKVAYEEEKTPILKRSLGRLRKRFIEEIDLESEDKAIKILFIVSDIDLKQNVNRNTRLRR